MSNDFSLICPVCNRHLFEINFTHNLTTMARAAGIYEVLWYPNQDYRTKEKPPQIIYNTAKEMIPILSNAIIDMEKHPKHYKKFNPSNGWGSYTNFMKIIDRIINACKQYPEARPYACT